MATVLRKMLADLTQAGVVRNVYHLETDSDCVYIGNSTSQTLSEVLTKLQKNRTITLTGDVTGSATYNGVDNVSINVAVSNDSHSHTGGTIDLTTGNRAVITDGNGHPTVSPVTSAELGYLDGVTSAIQTQLNNKAASNHNHDNVYVKLTDVGVSGKVVPLGEDGKISAQYLPSYVDDVIEGKLNSATSFTKTGESSPITPETGKIYADTTTNKTYRWSGTQYVELSQSVALGETSSTAYRGDRGKIAYEHSQSAHARTDATAVSASGTNGHIKINGSDVTVYTHPTGAGNMHIPAGGTKGQILRHNGTSGVAVWSDETDTTYNVFGAASATAAGTSGLVPAPAANRQNYFLRGDATWAIPVNTDTKVTTNPNGTTKFYLAGPTSASAATGTLIFDPNVYVDTESGSLVATKFTGDLVGNASTAAKLETTRSIRTNLASTAAVGFDGSANVTPGVTGILPIAHGGTGLSANPSMLVNLGSSGAATVMQASPRPGVTGILPIANGGTGNTQGQAALLGSNVLTNQNLNDYGASAAGKMFYAGGGNSVTNKPSGIDNFGMIVMRTASGWYTQILYGSDNNIYVRNWNSSAWTSWTKMYSTNAKPSAADIGAAASSHRHADVTTGASGFATPAMLTKLNGIAANANNYTHPSITATPGTASQTVAFGGTFQAISSVTVNNNGHVTGYTTKTFTMPSNVNVQIGGVQPSNQKEGDFWFESLD